MRPILINHGDAEVTEKRRKRVHHKAHKEHKGKKNIFLLFILYSSYFVTFVHFVVQSSLLSHEVTECAITEKLNVLGGDEIYEGWILQQVVFGDARGGAGRGDALDVAGGVGV